MKKTFITLCAVLIASVSMAAGHVDSVRYLTTKAGQNWFISADGNVDWWQGSDRNPAGNYTAVQWGKPSFGGSINVGKWINHKFGLRLSYDVNGGKSYINGRHIGLDRIQFLYGDDPQPDENGYYNTQFVYHNLHGDLLFSPVDFFQGYYNPNRIYTPVLYIGMGGACVGENILLSPTIVNNILARREMKQDNYDAETAQRNLKAANYEFSFAAGLINNFRLSDYFDIHVDLKWSAQRWNIDSWFYEYGTQGPDNVRPKRADYNYSAGLGLTYYIGGRIYELPYNYEKEMSEMRERIKNLEDELANQPEPQQIIAAPDTVVIFSNEIEAISYPFSIFFNLDSYQLMSKRDLVNLREIANVAKENNYKLRLRGSCDSATATPEYNQKLSENRCRKIMMELLDMGFPEENIILEPVGGVKELDPTEFDRRVLIDIIKTRE